MADETCPKCGTPRRSPATFCKHCGYRFGEETPVLVDSFVPAQSDAATAAPHSQVCRNCGATCPPAATFCRQCGHRLSGTAERPEAATVQTPAITDESIASPAPSPTTAATQVTRMHASLGLVIGAGAAAVVLAGVIAWVAYGRFSKASPVPVEKTVAAASANAAASPSVLSRPTPPPAVPPAPKLPSLTALSNAAPVTTGTAPVEARVSAKKPSRPAVSAPVRAVAKLTPPVTSPAAAKPPVAPPRSGMARAVRRTGRATQVAEHLVGTGADAFSAQDYTTAIADAKAALAVRPGYRQAESLLRRAETAQQQAMHSISIH